jgi:hypothetical protein
MIKFIEWLTTWLPEFWTILMCITVTFGLIAITIATTNWLFSLLGVL